MFKYLIFNKLLNTYHSQLTAIWFRALTAAEEEVITTSFHKVQVAAIGGFDAESHAIALSIRQGVIPCFVCFAVTEVACRTNWQRYG